MHNCKATREVISELLLAETDSFEDNALASDLENCHECRAEFDSVKNALRLTSRMVETVAPSDEYWNAYHATLRQKLINSRTAVDVSHTVPRTSWLSGFFKSSVPVPVPVAIGLVLSFVLSLLLVAKASRDGDIPPASLANVPVEVPVILEKPVIRIVYRERERRTIPKRSNGVTVDAVIDSTLAKSQSPKGLSGFKPLDEIKMTVIKGGSPNEK